MPYRVGDICRVMYDCKFTGAVGEITSVASEEYKPGESVYELRLLLGPFAETDLQFAREDSVQLLNKEPHND